MLLGKKEKPKEQAPFDPKTKSKEEQKLHPEHLAWQVPFESGTLRAEGVKNGKTVCVKEVRTTTNPYKIKLSYMMAEFVERRNIPPLAADDRDVVVIKAAILDKENNLVPVAENLVHFSVEGEGKIIGVGNGNITSHEPNKASSRRAYSGLCVAIIQSTTKVGQFNLRAESNGLKSDEIKIKTVPPEPVSIAVFAKPHNISLNQKLSVITAEIRDKFGTIVSSSGGSVIFKLKGPAMFENEKNVFEAVVVDGKATAKLQSVNQAGEVTITAFSEGIIPGKVDLFFR